MLSYIVKRIVLMIPTLIGISMIAFMIIQLPPGDYLTSLMSSMADSGQTVDPAQMARMREVYGLDDPLWLQYWKWISGIVFRGDFGWSFEWARPVSELIWERMGATLLISISSLLFVWAVSLPIGIYSAVHRHSLGDHVFTFFGFLGLAIPNFIMALTLMYLSYRYFGQSVGGLYSPEFAGAPWSWAKLMDLLAHLWIPIIVIGTSGTAALIRILRANLTDELNKPYVITARAKGLPESQVLLQYPVRIALNPFVSAIGWVLPELISGVVITAIVLNLPAAGPLLLRALVSQDMYLAGSFILLMGVLTLIGMLISDILLALLDPPDPVQLMSIATDFAEDRPAISPLRPGDDPAAIAVASQWSLIWHKFARNRVALGAGIVILCFYLVGIFAEFLAPALPNAARPQYTYAPPQGIALFVTGEGGRRQWLPHVKGYSVEVDPVALRRTFVVDPEKVIPIGFFVRGPEYKMWGLFKTDLHFFGPLDKNDPVYLLGTDKLGRDLLSRLIYGTRVSMSIGLIGVASSLIIGVVLGSLSGFYGGWVDLSIQRLIEIISAMPTIPLWLGLAAAVPVTWSPLQVYFIITLIVSLLAWTGLAREVRGRFFSLRGEDFVTAARLDGSSERRVIFRHILPSLTSHILAVVTLAIPTMIVAETALSFLGVGLKPPVVSYGVLLQDAQNIRTVATAPWLLIWPSLAVVAAVLSFNFMGDGLRDAADPYEH